MKITVNLEKCTGCRACVKACPFDAISMVEKKAVIDLDKCTYCGSCVEACRFEAIAIEREPAAVSTENLESYRGVWVFAEQRSGHLARVAFELLGEGRRLAGDLGQPLCAAYIGPENGSVESLLKRGADRVYAVTDDSLLHFQDEPYAAILTYLVRTYRPAILLAGATYIGRSFIPRVAARLRTGLTADCTGLAIDPETKLLAQTRPTFGGNLMATIFCEKNRPQMATVRPRTFDEAPVGAGGGEAVRVPFSEIAAGNRVTLDRIIPGSEEIDLTDAEIIVSGGRGLGKPEGFALIKGLADALGGVVGASRAAVDAGWISYAHQVGQTGKTVKPKLYFACGISGAIQHLAGMGTSDVIVALNKDPEAPIFKVANYGLVGDLYEIIPALVKRLKQGGA
ncbi:MAG TPA: FAD-binding protein [bacterium]|uniref:Acryloyl-CoA reductase electron transfer subunit beta n=1 Tax=candidate division TA06 bacterium ADurb.Bin417 TaxID=1852828 RepID=A0A1V5MFT1_UNCT6|nr:MAG: Acryloyl-CoA reductase electron transfer subunit beta [candidate division TA06 bacterium ADurb.Bin417]HNQ35315.1 FAD-binding protein [bacterium]HNS49462.1 FAD-binding protein [bacterium]